MYILFEGIDTCGKSTQIDLISKKYPDVITTHEPGGTLLGREIRKILLDGSISSKKAELLLFLADRAEHYEEIIQPNIDKTIISDRGFISGIGYAMANEDFDFNTLFKLNLFALNGKLPDKVVLFLIDIETLQNRTSQKKLDGIELRGLEYLIKAQNKMQESLHKLDINYLEIDTTKSIEEIHQEILDYLEMEGR